MIKTRDKDFYDFTKHRFYFLQTIDLNLAQLPNRCIGEVYIINPQGFPGPDAGGRISLGYVQTVKPDLKKRELYTIEVLKQTVTEKKNLVLTANIIEENDFTPNAKIELWGESAQVFL